MHLTGFSEHLKTAPHYIPGNRFLVWVGFSYGSVNSKPLYPPKAFGRMVPTIGHLLPVGDVGDLTIKSKQLCIYFF